MPLSSENGCDRGVTMMAYMAGQLLFFALIAALIGGVIWAVQVMRKPRPPLGEHDDEDEW